MNERDWIPLNWSGLEVKCCMKWKYSSKAQVIVMFTIQILLFPLALSVFCPLSIKQKCPKCTKAEGIGHEYLKVSLCLCVCFSVWSYSACFWNQWPCAVFFLQLQDFDQAVLQGCLQAGHSAGVEMLSGVCGRGVPWRWVSHLCVFFFFLLFFSFFFFFFSQTSWGGENVVGG